MSEQLIALVITVLILGLFCAWIPLLDFLAILIRRWILIRKLGRIVIGETFLEDYSALPQRGWD